MAQAARSRIASSDAADRRAPAFRIADIDDGEAFGSAQARRVAPPYPSAMRRARRRARLTGLTVLAGLAAAGWAVLAGPHGGTPKPIAADPAPLAARAPGPAHDPAPRRPAPRPDIAWMLDPAPALGAGAGLGREPPPAAAFRLAAAEPAAAAIPAAVAEVAAPAPVAEPVRIAEATPAALVPAPALVPLPVARPAELGRPPATPQTRIARRALPRTRDVFRAAMAEEPSFLESLFGIGRTEGRAQALAYADPDALAAPRQRLGAAGPSLSPAAGVAVYDISAGTVTLPGGAVLEAHSGYGDLMDDPRYVHVRMRGATPPGAYDLTERERPFHGVRAIRLTPVGGSAAIHGRDGILAHTYMLRQPGASNGCVVFRDYDRFLQAFLRGEVRRLVVVAGNRGDATGGRIGMADRPSRRG